MATSEPWKEHWAEAPDSTWKRQGGMSTITLVVRNQTQDSKIFALKKLKRAKDPERRRRMYREVVALETIVNSGTPQVIEHNCASYAEVAVPLFAVFEFVPGATLQEYVEDKGPIAVSDALVLTDKLLKTLALFHEANYGHRDIKPDNIILRDNDPRSPVLVDFGQTFNLDDPAPDLTNTSEQVGNRFLWLPEHAPGSGNKRDLRSDITFCVGILFYALTGILPSAPWDHTQAMPHQNPAARKAIDLLPQSQGLAINQIFDRGFQYNPDQRWQSIGALRDALSRVGDNGKKPFDLEDKLRFMREMAALRSGSADILRAMNVVATRLHRATAEAARQLGDGYQTEIENQPPFVNGTQVTGWVRCGINAFTAGSTINTFIDLVGVGTEITVEERLRDGNNGMLARLPVSNPNADDGLIQRIAERIIENVYEELSRSER